MHYMPLIRQSTPTNLLLGESREFIYTSGQPVLMGANVHNMFLCEKCEIPVELAVEQCSHIPIDFWGFGAIFLTGL